MKYKNIASALKFNWMKILAAGLAILIALGAGIVGAFGVYNYEYNTREKINYVHKERIAFPAQFTDPLDQVTADAQLADPLAPATYTYQVNYKLNRDNENMISYQPYIATVGADEFLTSEEKAKINKIITLPEFGGYVAPSSDYKITYDQVRNHPGTKDYIYQPRTASVKIKHVFQSLNNRNDFHTIAPVWKDQNAKVGSTLVVNPLSEKEIRGFRPEINAIKTQVPQNLNDFFVEYRYLRQSYNVHYDTAGGSFIPGKRVFYGQTIPQVENPSKKGAIFKGWKINTDLHEIAADNTTKKQLYKEGDLTTKSDFKEAMPAKDITFTAQWDEEPKAKYTVLLFAEIADYEQGKEPKNDAEKKYNYVGAKVIEDAISGSQPDPVAVGVTDIIFPDLPVDATAKASFDPQRFAKYYKLNAAKTQQMNLDKKTRTQKTVKPTGETVYRVYYDRQIYTLVWESLVKGGFPVKIVKDGITYDSAVNPYIVKARFGQLLVNIWPKDGEVLGYEPKRYSQGWKINLAGQNSVYRDTPPYRLSVADFLEATDVVKKGGFRKESTSRAGVVYDDFTISLGMSQSQRDGYRPIHVDFQLEGFDGKYHYAPELYYWKSDTTSSSYPFPAPYLRGFTTKNKTKRAADIASKQTLLLKNTGRIEAEKVAYDYQSELNGRSFTNAKGPQSNGYLLYIYNRDKYRLQLNNDPNTIKEDNAYQGEDIRNVFYQQPLKDLHLDEYVPSKPANLPAEYQFLGWHEDPAGTLPIKKSDVTMPNYVKTLYAKWGLPLHTQDIIFDPNGGTLAEIQAADISVCESAEVELEEDCQTPTKAHSVNKKQHFTIGIGQQIKEPIQIPTLKGKDFLGWEIVRYKKDGSEDTSYKEKYGVPELYAFQNPISNNVHLRAIWVDNDLVDLTVENHFFAKDGTEEIKKVILPNHRIGSYVSYTGAQNDEWTLKDEKGFLKDLHHFGKNQYIQTLRVLDAEDIAKLPTKPTTDQPVAKQDANTFKYYFRPYRQRTYKVNYVNGVPAQVDKYRLTGKPGIKGNNVDPSIYPIVDQEVVVNGKRHFEARNFRSIPGWKLISPPQQQLIFDLDANTGELIGINGARGEQSDEVNFYYQDVRVIQRKIPNAVTPSGYHRVTFTADEGGNFGIDSAGKEIKQIFYDVIDGLDFKSIPVPSTEKSAAKPEQPVITPELGYKFVDWQDSALLDPNTKIKQNYNFTAKFKTIKDVVEIVDGNEKFPKNFVEVIVDTTDKVQNSTEKQIRFFRVNPGVEVLIPVTDPVGKKENIRLQDGNGKSIGKQQVQWTFRQWEKVSETMASKNGQADSVVEINPPQVVNFREKHRFIKKSTRIVAQYKKSIPAMAMEEIGADTLEVAESLRNVNNFLPSEKQLVKQLKGVPTGSQVKIRDYNNIYEKLRENGKSNTEEVSRIEKAIAEVTSPKGIKSIITIPIKVYKNIYSALPNGDRPAYVPANYVPVQVIPTELNQDIQKKVYYVNPKAKVLVPVPDTPARVGYRLVNWTWNNTVFTVNERHKFVEAAQIVAQYETKGASEKHYQSGVKVIETTVGTPVNVLDYRGSIVPPTGLTIQDVTLLAGGHPDLSKAGNTVAKVRITYDKGVVQELEIPVLVRDNVIPGLEDGSKPQGVPPYYKKVTFVPTDKAVDPVEKVFYVNPQVIVSIDIADPRGIQKIIANIPTTFHFQGWDHATSGQFQEDTVITAKYKKSIPGAIIEFAPVPTPAPKPEPIPASSSASVPAPNQTSKAGIRDGKLVQTGGVGLLDTALLGAALLLGGIALRRRKN